MPKLSLYRRPSADCCRSPGDSCVPANHEPIMTLEAPAASAMATSRGCRTPPSAQTCLPCRAASAAHSRTAENCGRPTTGGVHEKVPRRHQHERRQMVAPDGTLERAPSDQVPEIRSDERTLSKIGDGKSGFIPRFAAPGTGRLRRLEEYRAHKAADCRD